jgi:hypothetical protein
MTACLQSAALAAEQEGNERLFRLPAKAASEIPRAAWAASARLLTTLDLEQVLVGFERELRRRVSYQGLLYQHEEEGIVFSSGSPGRHTVSYRLVFGEKWLGSLTLSRRRRFTAEELARLEPCVCGLLYALRNALQYRESFANRS